MTVPRFVIDAHLVAQLDTAADHGVVKSSLIGRVIALRDDGLSEINVRSVVDAVITSEQSAKASAAFRNLTAQTDMIIDLFLRANADTIVLLAVTATRQGVLNVCVRLPRGGACSHICCRLCWNTCMRYIVSVGTRLH
jgi:hypothetical protein